VHAAQTCMLLECTNILLRYPACTTGLSLADSRTLQCLGGTQAHFRLSLGEAAQRLGVCASTLKRVCRRKGIPAWPQRKLVKLSRAVDQVCRLLPNTTGIPSCNAGTVWGWHPTLAMLCSGLALLKPSINANLAVL
jgi:hypothetical protein